jgi:hypothetical protein
MNCSVFAGSSEINASQRLDIVSAIVPKGTIKYCQTVPNSALDRDRDTVEACRLVLGMIPLP